MSTEISAKHDKKQKTKKQLGAPQTFTHVTQWIKWKSSTG